MLFSYLVSLVIVLVFSFFGVYISAAKPLWYLDVPSIIMVFLPSFVLCAGDYGWKGIGMAFSAAFGRQPRTDQELVRAQATATALGRYSWYAAVFGTCIGFIAILASLSQAQDSTRLGPNVAVSLICFFYALMFNFMLITPMRNRIALKRGSTE